MLQENFICFSEVAGFVWFWDHHYFGFFEGSREVAY